jgi:Tol biopolymer transport system component/DNA-binding winged helix-turn-helix (wHTH) protein
VDLQSHPGRIVQFGPFKADLDSGELFRDGLKVHLPEQPFRLLSVLLENPGGLVSRDELQRRLWAEGTHVDFDRSLNTAASKLREALGDAAGYVETVPKRGYRFIVPLNEAAHVEPAPTAQAADHAAKRGHISRYVPWAALDDWREAPKTESETRFRRRWMWAMVVAIATAALSGLAWMHFAKRNETQLPEVTLITRTLGRAEMPAFSPDGKQIAYQLTSEEGKEQSIYVHLIGTDSHLRLTTGTATARDCCPQWSQDGRYIVFLREGLEESGYYIVSVLGGPARRVVPIDSDYYGLLDCPLSNADWLPDGKHLVVGKQQGFGQLEGELGLGRPRLVSANIDTGEEVAMTDPPLNTLGDNTPRVSPDGEIVAFLRQADDAIADVYLLRLKDRHLWRLTKGHDLDGMTWSADSRHIIAHGLINGKLGFWRISIDDGKPLPSLFTLNNVSEPSVARIGNRLAYTSLTASANLWRIDLKPGSDRNTSRSLAVRLISSSGVQGDPAYSSDGRKLAFHSDRSGTFQIWTCNADGSDMMRLTSMAGGLTGTPRWSPNGSMIAFDSRASGSGNAEIFVVPASGGAVRRITQSTFNDVVPSWSRDGKWIYFGSSRSGEPQIWKVSAESGETASRPAIQVTQNGALNAFESSDGKYLYFAGKAGLWRRAVAGDIHSPEECVVGSLRFWGLWAIDTRGAYFIDIPPRNGSKPQLKFFDFASKRISTLREFDYAISPWNPGIALSPDGRWLVYEQLEQQVANIVLVENFR